MALGTLTSVAAENVPGPLFIDRVSMPGDTSYPTSGTLGFLAALRALRKDQRTIISVRAYKADVGYSVGYDPAADLLIVRLEDQTSGVVAEVANATNLSSHTFLLEIVSK